MGATQVKWLIYRGESKRIEERSRRGEREVEGRSKRGEREVEERREEGGKGEVKGRSGSHTREVGDF